MTKAPVRIANCSAFYGDRLEAAREMVEGGPIDVLTGDYLAELTLAILARQRAKDPAAGYARTFVRQLEDVAVACRERGVRIVVNAGGLSPTACADACRAVYRKLGLDTRVAYIEGDDLSARLGEIGLAHAETGESLPPALSVLTANAYLGAWGIVEALSRGAELVICPRVTDASLVVGPAAWRFGWARDDWDRLAAAVVAGHVIECGPQCTGGNHPFFEEVPNLEQPGFPIAEVHEDGDVVVTKHPGTGRLVSVDTVTAQLVYEIAGPRYPTPDVTARFDTIALRDDGPDRVRIRGVRGEPPPATAKVTVHHHAGFANRVSFVIAGRDVEAKAALAERALWSRLGGRERFEESYVSLRGGDGYGVLTVAVAHRDRDVVGRAFSGRAVELATASYPGALLAAPPQDARPRLALWPAVVAADRVDHRVVLEDGSVVNVPPAPMPERFDPLPLPTLDTATLGPTRDAPLGALCGARSGDKGGDANVGVWTRDPACFGWLAATLTCDRLRALLPEIGDHPVERFELPNLHALNFVVRGLLGDGAAANLRDDPQAKTLGETLRAAVAPIPSAWLSP